MKFGIGGLGPEPNGVRGYRDPVLVQSIYGDPRVSTLLLEHQCQRINHDVPYQVLIMGTTIRRAWSFDVQGQGKLGRLSMLSLATCQS